MERDRKMKILCSDKRYLWYPSRMYIIKKEDKKETHRDKKNAKNGKS